MTNDKQREWREVVGYEGLYEVSNLGEVRSMTRKQMRKGGKGPWHIDGQPLKPGINTCGYPVVVLSNKDRIAKTKTVHRLVATAFIKNEKGYKQINHKNGVKSDNSIDNLEWCTRSSNMKHASKVIGMGKKKLKQEDVDRIRELYNSGEYNYGELSELYNVSMGHIRKIIINKSWVKTN